MRQKPPTTALKEFGLPVAGAVLDREGRGTLKTPKSHAGSRKLFLFWEVEPPPPLSTTVCKTLPYVQSSVM